MRYSPEKPSRQPLSPKKTGSWEEDNRIAGRNAVLEALKSGRGMDAVYVTSGEKKAAFCRSALCREKRIPVKEAAPQKLDFMVPGVSHQGVVAVASSVEYASVEEILRLAREKGQDPFVVLADQVEDPHNLGAIIRSAEAARRPRGADPQAPGGAGHSCGEKKRRRRLRIYEDRPGGQPGLRHGTAEKRRPLDLRRGHGRRHLVPDPAHRPPGPGHRLGGTRHEPAGEGTLRRDSGPAHEREGQLPERLGGGGNPAV